MARCAIFIDGAYLEFVLKQEFGRPSVDFAGLVSKIAGSSDLLRAYYYDCLPYQSARPTPDESERFARRQKFHHALNLIPRFEVRLGKLAFRGHQNGRPIFEQKRVDILLGVDLVQLAAKHQITDAMIVAGDSDFLPAVEAALPVPMWSGLITWVF